MIKVLVIKMMIFRQPACFVTTKSQLTILLSSLIARWGSDLRFYDDSDLNTYIDERVSA